jgi:hypothetical protein
MSSLQANPCRQDWRASKGWLDEAGGKANSMAQVNLADRVT